MHDAEYARKFWTRVEKTDSCWLWRSSVGKPGYGAFFFKGRKCRAAHRVAWELTHGAIPAGMYVCHTCDVRHCVNPAHLFVGTPQDNRLDCKRKGRDKPPPRNPPPKLTDDDVVAIRELRGEGLTLLAIAQRFGVTEAHVSAICRGKSRRSVTGPLST